MRLLELFEASDKITVKSVKPRNFVAKNSQTSGAGVHNAKKKKVVKRDEKKLEDR